MTQWLDQAEQALKNNDTAQAFGLLRHSDTQVQQMLSQANGERKQQLQDLHQVRVGAVNGQRATNEGTPDRANVSVTPGTSQVNVE